MKSWLTKYSRYLALFLAIGFIVPLHEQSHKVEEEIEELELNVEWCKVESKEVKDRKKDCDSVSNELPLFFHEESHDFSLPTLSFFKASHYKLFILYSCLMVDRSLA